MVALPVPVPPRHLHSRVTGRRLDSSPGSLYAQLMNDEAYQVATPLFRAIETGQSAEVKALLAAGADPNECHGEDEDSALLIAAIEGREEIVAHLIAAGADVNLGDSRGYTPLMGAVCAHSLDIVQQLIAAGADVNHVCTRSQASALHDAATGNHYDIAAALLAAGAHADTHENIDGNTALMCAVLALSPSITELLLQAGADPNKRSSRGDTATELIDNEIPYLWEPIKSARAKKIQTLLRSATQSSSPATS